MYSLNILIKGPFRDPQPHPPFLSKKVKKVEIFTSAEAVSLGTLCAKYILQNHLFGEIIGRIVYLL